MSPTYQDSETEELSARLPSDYALRSLVEGLGSASRDDDWVEDDDLFELLLEFRLHQDEVIKALYGPAMLLHPLLIRLRSIIEEECRRSPTLAANFVDYLLIPHNDIHCDEVSNRFRYRLHLPACRKRHIFVVRRGPLQNLSELELNDWEEHDHPPYRRDFSRDDCCWQPVGGWLKKMYGEHEVRQTILEEYHNSAGIPFRLLELPVDLRYMIFEFVVGKQIWPHLPSRKHGRIIFADIDDDSDSDDDDDDSYEYTGPYIQDDARCYAYHNKLTLDGEYNHLIASAEMYYDSIYDAALDQLSAAGYDDYNYADALDEFSADGWYNGISTGVYPIPFMYRQGTRFQTSYEGSPLSKYIGLGPTQTQQTSAMSLLCVSRLVRGEVADILWSKSTKCFNRLNDLTAVARYLQKYCAQQELPGHVFEPRDPCVLRRVFLSLPNKKYLPFVGYSAEDNGVTKTKCDLRSRPGGLRLLSEIRTLEHLNLQFQVLTTQRDSLTPDYFNPWNPWPHHYRMYDVCCQKKFVDMIMTLGYEFLRDIREVTISGHVKSSNHRRWDPLLRDQTRTDEPRERRDMTAKVAKILAGRDVDMFPLICRCSTPCAWWDIRSDDGMQEFSCEDEDSEDDESDDEESDDYENEDYEKLFRSLIADQGI